MRDELDTSEEFSARHLVSHLLFAQPSSAQVAGAASSEPSVVPAHIATDQEIHGAVVKGIVINPNVFAADLHVRVKDGAVTLDGTVRDAAAKETAEEIASRVPGVVRVTNRLRLSN